MWHFRLWDVQDVAVFLSIALYMCHLGKPSYTCLWFFSKRLLRLLTVVFDSVLLSGLDTQNKKPFQIELVIF